MYSYFSGFFSLVYLAAPIIYLLTGISYAGGLPVAHYPISAGEQADVCPRLVGSER
ncbi:MAG: hypothetical protein SF029_20050 [bacterium]|nr:hypothetical protein [bacterium]